MTWAKAAGFATLAVGGVIITGGAGLVPILAVGAASSSAILVFDHPNGKYIYISPTLIQYDLKTLQGMNCDSFETAP